MKRLAAPLTIVAALALLPAQAASADILGFTAGVFPDAELAAQSSTGYAFAVGGGTSATGTHFAFSAHCKPTDPFEPGTCLADSGTASGHAVVSDPVLGEAQGHVCEVQVIPPGAVLVIVVEKGSGFLGSFPYLTLIAGDLPPDVFGVEGSFVCGIHAGGYNTDPVVQGNIVVKG